MYKYLLLSLSALFACNFIFAQTELKIALPSGWRSYLPSEREKKFVEVNPVPDSLRQAGGNKKPERPVRLYEYVAPAARQAGPQVPPRIDVTRSNSNLETDAQYLQLLRSTVQQTGNYMQNFRLTDTATFTTVNGIPAAYTSFSGIFTVAGNVMPERRVRMYIIPCRQYYYTIQMTDTELNNAQPEFEKALQTLEVSCP